MVTPESAIVPPRIPQEPSLLFSPAEVRAESHSTPPIATPSRQAYHQTFWELRDGVSQLDAPPEVSLPIGNLRIGDSAFRSETESERPFWLPPSSQDGHGGPTALNANEHEGPAALNAPIALTHFSLKGNTRPSHVPPNASTPTSSIHASRTSQRFRHSPLSGPATASSRSVRSSVSPTENETENEHETESESESEREYPRRSYRSDTTRGSSPSAASHSGETSTSGTRSPTPNEPSLGLVKTLRFLKADGQYVMYSLTSKEAIESPPELALLDPGTLFSRLNPGTLDVEQVWVWSQSKTWVTGEDGDVHPTLPQRRLSIRRLSGRVDANWVLKNTYRTYKQRELKDLMMKQVCDDDSLCPFLS